ncbi:MAG: hypothetical protein R2788_14465 [Saprospiraceae bacterium]
MLAIPTRFGGTVQEPDFEQKMLVKKDAANLVEQKIKNPNWQASPLMLSNADCYQPIEKKLEITLAFWKCMEIPSSGWVDNQEQFDIEGFRYFM